MASIDHTTIVFKNGKLMTELYKELEGGISEWLLPFDYGRDGDIYKVNEIDIWKDIKWHRDEYDAIYQRSGFQLVYDKTNVRSWIEWFKWKLHIMERMYYQKEVGEWSKDGIKVYIYHNHSNQSFVSFYIDEEKSDTYVVLGGYGHRCNVYTHFYERGYGDAFERKMALEAYRWCMEDVLKMVVESIVDGDMFDEEDSFKALQNKFGYKDYWDMSEEEREEYWAQEEIEVV